MKIVAPPGSRHSRERGNPACCTSAWIPGHAHKKTAGMPGMTKLQEGCRKIPGFHYENVREENRIALQLSVGFVVSIYSGGYSCLLPSRRGGTGKSFYLNNKVAGPKNGDRQKKFSRIYRATYDILEAVLHLFTIRSHMNPSTRPRRSLPATMNEAVEQFLPQLPLKEKSAIARMEQKDLRVLYPTLGRRMEKAFGLREGNNRLLADCSAVSGKPKLKTEEAVQMMVEALWRKLRDSHGLRVVH